MSNRYRHQQYGDVTIVSDFDHHVIIRTKDGLREARKTALTPIGGDASFNPFPGTIAESPLAPTEPETEPGTEPEMAAETVPNTLQAAINTMSGAQIAAILPGVGKARAKRIIDAKPEGGYVDFADLQSAVPDLFGDDDEAAAPQWAAIEPLISYAS
jgi:hypothetical protein